MVNLKAAPFFLTDEQISWVERTRASMTLDEKIGQLFFPIGYSPDPGYLQHCMLRHHIGGLLFRTGKGDEIRSALSYLQENSKIPLLIAANLESGGTGLVEEGTHFANPMQIAATENPSKHAYALGSIACKEAAALGCNYAFAPVVDIDTNFRNPITNVRTYGADVDTIIDCATQYMAAAKEAGCATAPKHFPGDGVDERDQHILTSINDLAPDAWDASFGKIYSAMIAADALSIMSGHIALPEYAKALGANEGEAMLPASLSFTLLHKLLREKLGFNGLIISDATPMVGFCCAMPRADAVPKAIEAGCDMFLFNKDLDEDVLFMQQGYEKGILTDKRLNEAVTRILAMKATMHLPEKQLVKALIPDIQARECIGSAKHLAAAQECADEAITLVRDRQGILPLSAHSHRRVLLQLVGDFPSNERVLSTMQSALEAEGFEITRYQREGFDENGSMCVDTVQQFQGKYDLVLYIGNVENASNQTVNRIHWYTFFGLGNNVPWFVKEVPTLFVSLANPYHLLDVPMVDTYINAYTNSDTVIETVVAKLMGRSSFKGKSPTDPFCGKSYL